ncbi:MAG: hypothetical protein ACFCUF_05785, partial [Paucihalobacter sp.]
MSNFTRRGSGVKFWQAISNLSCCSVDLITKQIKSVKALAFIALFAFSIGSTFAQTANRSVFFDRCVDDRPAPNFDAADFAMIFQTECGESELTLTITENVQGDDCNWQVIYSYNISCGDFSTTTKEFFEGGDRTAPELIGEIPDGQAGLNFCFDAIPAGPSIDDIALLFEDECSDVTVTKIGQPTGDDCEWSVIYSYEVFDACGNQYGEDIRIEYSGGDTASPVLKKGATIPSGNLASELCFLEKEQGPSEEDIAALFEDNCGDINVVKYSYSKGTDCKWMAEYTYIISDDCGNEADPVIIVYQGRDDEAPVLNGIPEDTTASCLDALPQIAKGSITATDNCDNNVEIVFVEDTSELGLACEGGIVVRTWTATDDCGNSVSESQTIIVEPAPQAEFDAIEDYSIACEDLSSFQAPILGYSNGILKGACLIEGEVQGTFEPFTENCGSFVVSFEYIDECERVSTASVTVTVVDETAPTFTAPADIEIFTDADCAYDASIGVTGDVTDEADNCTLELEATYVDSVADGQCEGSKIITRTWSLVDECGNAAADQVQIITVTDNIAPTFTAPADIEIFTDADCAYDASVGVTGDVMDEADNCTTELEATYVDSIADGECEGSKIITRTWSLVDDCGNAAE